MGFCFCSSQEECENSIFSWRYKLQSSLRDHATLKRFTKRRLVLVSALNWMPYYVKGTYYQVDVLDFKMSTTIHMPSSHEDHMIAKHTTLLYSLIGHA